MKYKVTLNNLINNKGLILCLGFFDGLHLGHQKLIEKTIEIAKLNNLNAGLLTFSNIPINKENKRFTKKVLSSNKEKENIIKNYDLNQIIFIDFDDECRLTSKENFVRFLKDEFNCKGVVVGEDYRFGSNGEGNVNYLLSLRKEDFIVEVIPQIKMDNEIISSTRIISLLNEGNISQVNKLLGRNYSLTGIVEKGFSVGKTLDFPTANISFDDNIILPLNGVYAVNVIYNNIIYKGVANIGIRPSINTMDLPLLEVHIFSFNDDLYQKELKVEFKEFIRKETKFASVELLKEQIIKDKKKALELL